MEAEFSLFLSVVAFLLSFLCIVVRRRVRKKRAQKLVKLLSLIDFDDIHER
jgi:uncharacterized membrane protein